MSETERLAAALGGRYQIERQVGQGGMAVVYLARDLKHDRRVALKVLRPELSSAMGVDRFPREIHLVAQMHHPHILPLHDSGEASGFLYYVMPFVDGETLRQRIARSGSLSISETLRLLREIADALSYAHGLGVIHRDIKPDNVMLSGKHATVTDFGVAKAVQASTTDKLTTVGIAVGTPQYMAPEQAVADEKTNHRADIYALGVLGYEMLSGEPLFNGPTAQAILSAHVLQEPPDIRTRRADVPPALAEALLKCVAKDPEQRWQHAEELLTALEGIVATPSGGLTPTNTRPVKAVAGLKAGGAAPTAPARKRWLIPVIATLVLAVAGGVLAIKGLGGSGSGEIKKIGVLPIEDISGQDALFVAAMHDGLTNALSKLQLSGVASRSEMMRYKGAGKTTREIAKESELGAVVEATVFRAGQVIRINVQFTEPVSGRALWSETIERNVSDVLKAQDAMVQEVANGVKGALTAQPKRG